MLENTIKKYLKKNQILMIHKDEKNISEIGILEDLEFIGIFT